MGSRLPMRNLSKQHLGGVIFGCTCDTMGECLSKQLFGLPGVHISYVKNIEPGLPLFLFNYTDRTLHGIYEAASPGSLNIDSYAWTEGGTKKTGYPAQVRVIMKLQCQALTESQFKPIIVDNYFNPSHFRFELDHGQASKLRAKFIPLAVHVRTRIVVPKNPPLYKVKQAESKASEPNLLNGIGSNGKSRDSIGISGTSNDKHLNGISHLGESSAGNQVAESNEKDLMYLKLKELALNGDKGITGHVVKSAVKDNAHLELRNEEDSVMTLGKTNIEHSLQSNGDIIAKLCEEIEELKTFKKDQTRKMEGLEKKQAEATLEINRLVNRCMMLESVSNTAFCADENPPDEFLKESILLVGGHDGSSWSSTIHTFSPSLDRLWALRPMSSSRGYAAVAQVNKEIYVFGGGRSNGEWYDIVESYNMEKDEWTLREPLKTKTGCLAGAALNGKIYALGGGNGSLCFSDVEMLDLVIGRWMHARSMKQQRFGLAAVELNGSIYAVGGYDGDDYLKSAERFDPREHCWTSIASMDKKKGCHSLVVLNEKIYAIGGYDGTMMVPDVEIYDPRAGTWMAGEPMNHSRGYLCAAVLNESIYVMGGVTENEDLVETVEYYKEGQGWQDTYLSAVGIRCFASTIVPGHD